MNWLDALWVVTGLIVVGCFVVMFFEVEISRPNNRRLPIQRRKISRKMLVATVGAAGVLLAEFAGVEISAEAYAAIVTLLSVWLLGEAGVDAADRIGKRGDDDDAS